MLVTTGDVLSGLMTIIVTRGYNSTTAVAHGASDPVYVFGSNPNTGLLAGNINGSITGISITGGGFKEGEIITLDSEQMLIIGTGSEYKVIRGYNNTTGASHANNTVVYHNGGFLPRIFTGIIHQPQESSRGYQVSYDCLDRSYMLMQNKAVTTVSQNVSANSFLTTILGQLPSTPVYAPVPSGQRVLDSGLFPIQFALMDDESCWEEGSKVANADGEEFKLAHRVVEFVRAK
jgi:hypothetical protein